ncbi:hypothetical protein FG91_02616 [Sphingopyxis sp. LC81]|nr:hypothetical protein FG91_02616 [Sphingopyxis sp. LC81]
MSAIMTNDVRERQMTNERPMGGEVTACRMEEREDGRFVTYFTLSWLPRERLLIVQKSPKDRPRARVWANATLGLRHIRDVLWYDGPVTFTTVRQRPDADEPAWARIHREASSRTP